MLISEPGLTNSSLNFHWQVLSAASTKSDYRPKKLPTGLPKPNKGASFLPELSGRGGNPGCWNAGESTDYQNSKEGQWDFYCSAMPWKKNHAWKFCEINKLDSRNSHRANGEVGLFCPWHPPIRGLDLLQIPLISTVRASLVWPAPYSSSKLFS